MGSRREDLLVPLIAIVIAVATVVSVLGASLGSDAPSLRAEPESTKAPSDVAEVEERRCWDGVEVSGGDTCSIDHDSRALFAAFGVDDLDCVEEKVEAWNRLSYACHVGGVEVHVASYSSVEAREDRLRAYGTCRSAEGGRRECGPTSTGRHVLVYVDPGLLMYASVGKDGYSVLEQLRDGTHLTAEELLHGVRG